MNLEKFTPPEVKYKSILLFGMPGSGKGTQGLILGQLPGMLHVSCGEIFRKLPRGGELGKEVMAFTSQGNLVPDDLTVRIWSRHLQILELQEFFLPEKNVLILDGLPRNLDQAKLLADTLDVVQIFHLDIADESKARERLKSRALKENRLDDTNDEVIRKRLDLYYAETYETLSFYPKEIVTNIDAAQSPLLVLRDIVNRLAEILPG
ncbi:MAG: adenylate kinase family protein [bacterium]